MAGRKDPEANFRAKISPEPNFQPFLGQNSQEYPLPRRRSPIPGVKLLWIAISQYQGLPMDFLHRNHRFLRSSFSHFGCKKAEKIENSGGREGGEFRNKRRTALRVAMESWSFLVHSKSEMDGERREKHKNDVSFSQTLSKITQIGNKKKVAPLKAARPHLYQWRSGSTLV